MKQRLKLMAVMLAVVLALGMLSACGASAGQSSDPGAQASETQTPESEAPESEAPETQEPDDAEETPDAEVNYTTEELSFYRDGLKIYGELLLPEGEGPFPLVILSHGYGGNHTQTSGMAKKLVMAGIAAYAFDFIGGGRNSSSDGDPVDMSVLTEAADLNAVLDGLSEQAEIDTDNIFLCGYSQGGMVSAYVAAARPEDVKALVLFYPAFVLHDDAEEAYPDHDNIPDEIDFMGMTIGRKYYEDAFSFNIYDLIPNYTGDVLIFHGTSDTIVPIEYSQRAAETFPSAELVTVENGSHGNLGEACDTQAIDFVLQHIG